jgi:hypothetical protein
MLCQYFATTAGENLPFVSMAASLEGPMERSIEAADSRIGRRIESSDMTGKSPLGEFMAARSEVFSYGG